jgi:hypothetical protein
MRVKAQLLAVIAAAVFVANAAADPPRGGGPPEPLSNVTTGACVGFAPGDVLTFTGLTTRYVSVKEWFDPEIGFMTRVTAHFSATAVSGDYSYALDATLHYTGFAQVDFTMTGRTTIRRSDGRSIKGDAHIYWQLFFDPFTGSGDYRLEWLSGPTGARCE